jgi:hypothetical protein
MYPNAENRALASRLETGPDLPPPGGRSSQPKCYVYVLRNLSDRPRYYTGVTSDWHARLTAHNAGKCPHTADKRPWQIDVLTAAVAGL